MTRNRFRAALVAVLLAAPLAAQETLFQFSERDFTQSTAELRFSLQEGDEFVEIRVQGETVAVLLDGGAMPEERYDRNGPTILVRDRHGRPMARFVRFGSSGTLHALPRSKPRLRLGLSVEPPSEALASHMDLDPERTLYVAGVEEAGAAARAGLRKHDVIVALRGEKGVDREQLQEVLGEMKPGEELAVTVLRGGNQEITVGVVPAVDASTPVFAPFAVGSYTPFQLDPQGNLFYLPGEPATQDLSLQAYDRLFSGTLLPFEKRTMFQRLVDLDAPATLPEKIEQLEQRLETVQKLLERIAEKQASNR